VLVENQLERTDHGHLGQLLTYASGLEAVTIVWIAARFSEEHRSTLDWLNKITDESFRFFGLEVELWRIGEGSLSSQSSHVDEAGFHLEETPPEIVGPDMAIVLFYPENRNRWTIRISSRENAPDNNVIHVDRPLAQALIGATIDETVELEVSGKPIRMVVERIYPDVAAAE
jgi:hypothetical protein